MALPCASHYLLIVLVLIASMINLSSGYHLVKGSVACTDCNPPKDLAGIRLAVKCRNELKQKYALTNTEGYFTSEIPTNSSPANCFVALLGGPKQLWAFKKSLVSKITSAAGSDGSYGLSTPLSFFATYPLKGEEGPNNGGNKPEFSTASAPPTGIFPPMGFLPPVNLTDLPLIFFFPFLPIIGIP